METKSITTFSCPWSMGVTFWTAITVIILSISTYYVWTNELIWLRYTLIIIFLATIIGVLLLMPLRLTIESNKIALHRLIGSIHIPFKDIIELRRLQLGNSIFYSFIRKWWIMRIFGQIQE